MRGAELREWLDRMEDAPVPEPDAAFVARLEADLRVMGADADTGTDEKPARGHGGRRRRRAFIAAGPVVALTAAAAAAAVTFLPGDPKPRQVSTADPGVTVPTSQTAPPVTEPGPPTSTPTTVATPPWLPAGGTPATAPPTTAAAKRVAAGPAEHKSATMAPLSHDPATTVPAPTTTTPPPATESMTLRCTAAVSSGPVVRCEWNQSTSASFRWYRLWREAAASSRAVVFQSDNRPTITYYDRQVQAGGTRYYYKLDVIDASGNVLAYSPIVTVTCC